MKSIVLVLVSTVVTVSVPEIADAQCNSGYRHERTRILNKAPKRRLFRGKSKRGRVCLRVARPTLRKMRRLYLVDKGRTTEIAAGRIPRNADRSKYRWKTRVRKDEIVCPAGTHLERTSSFQSSPRRRLVRRKNLRIYVPGHSMSSRVWIAVLDGHKRGAKLRRVRVWNTKSYTCLGVQRPKR